MRKEIKWFIVGILLALSVSALADNWQTISVQPNLINVVVNGEKLNADNFLYNDTTYVPIRAVSEALNFNVEYDEETNTAYIGKKKSQIAGVNSNVTKEDVKLYGMEAIKNKDGVEGVSPLDIIALLKTIKDNHYVTFPTDTYGVYYFAEAKPKEEIIENPEDIRVNFIRITEDFKMLDVPRHWISFL